MRTKIRVITEGGYHAIQKTTSKWWITRSVEYYDFKSCKFVPSPPNWLDRFRRLWVDGNDWKVQIHEDGKFTIQKMR